MIADGVLLSPLSLNRNVCGLITLFNESASGGAPLNLTL